MYEKIIKKVMYDYSRKKLNDRDRIMCFMRIKTAILNENDLFGDYYYSYEDEKELKKIRIKDAKKIWKEIKDNIILYGIGKGLIRQICYWCIKHDNKCDKCTFMKRHGICGGDGSIVALIVNEAKRNKKKLTKILSHKVYVNIINTIEEYN